MKRIPWNKGITGYKHRLDPDTDVRFKDWDDLKYHGKHRRMERIIPKPVKCQLCGIEKPRVLSNRDHKYRNDPADWWWLCRFCHFDYDIDSDHSRSVRGKRGRFTNKITLGA